jgi:hypothetical protein
VSRINEMGAPGFSMRSEASDSISIYPLKDQKG